jgi:UDP-4-amino-4-deoxy-L-arabinose formyltransferase/UDP-glucuronic acid dehydrogenase (UDP-4-keto-hexauronic acid decarboxylating)
MYKRLVIFGDNIGVPQLLNVVANNLIKGIVLSSMRPQYFDEIKSIAEKNEIPTFIQPKFDSTEYDEFTQDIKKMEFDMLFCNCYSMIIRKDILSSVNFNAINIHWSLLPLNKGPNPTQWAIIKGEKKTGISIHYMDEGLDTGDIIAQMEVDILDTDTWVTVNEKLKKLSTEFIASNMNSILTGNNKRQKQNDKLGSVNKRLTADSPKIDFQTMSDIQIFNLIRAQVAPLKGAYIKQGEKQIHFDTYLSLNEIIDLRKMYAS